MKYNTFGMYLKYILRHFATNGKFFNNHEYTKKKNNFRSLIFLRRYNI